MTSGAARRGLMEVVERRPLWEPGSDLVWKIPWDDPDFSRRMLAEHLEQRHDHASRRFEAIDKHIEWIFGHVMGRLPGSVLDLGCGPGLYTERLSAMGSSCTGIDFSPASIEYAQHNAVEHGLACTYRCEDLLEADLGEDHDVALLLLGEFNTFDRNSAAQILSRTHAAICPGATLVLEAHTYDYVVAAGDDISDWYSSNGGLFSSHPHLVLIENAWDAQNAATRTRYFVVDAASGQIDEYGEQLIAYTNDEYRDCLRDAGFTEIEFAPAMGDIAHPGMLVVTARKADST